MKKIIIIGLLFSSFGFADAELDLIVNKIQKERDSLGLKKLDVTDSPFVTISEKTTEAIPIKKFVEKKKRKAVFILNGLMNNKAFLNGSWFKVGDVILGFELRYIGHRGIILTKQENGKQVLKKVFMESSIPKNKRINFFES